MWITLFTIVGGIALGLAIGAIVLESGGPAARRDVRHSPRNLRAARNS
jgi:hypothetical protein